MLWEWKCTASKRVNKHNSSTKYSFQALVKKCIKTLLQTQIYKWTCKIGVEEFTQSLKTFLAATMWINECLLLYLPFIPSPTSTRHTAHKFIWRMNTVQNPQNSQVKYISHLSLPQNTLNSHVLLIVIHSQLAPAHIIMHKCLSL